jgi:hypothetical protein
VNSASALALDFAFVLALVFLSVIPSGNLLSHFISAIELQRFTTQPEVL